MARRSWTADEVRRLGVHTDVPTAASVLGIGRSAGYDLVRRNEFPVPVLRLGHRIVVPVHPILELLGIDIASEPPSNDERKP